jgi:hypothetical protein
VPLALALVLVPIRLWPAQAVAASAARAGLTLATCTLPHLPACSINSNPNAKGDRLIQKFLDNMPRGCADTANKACSK